VEREGEDKEGGGLEEEGALSLKEGGHQGHGVLMVRWGSRVLQGCVDLAKVVLQDLPLQALTRYLFLFCICV
jgi:hypothetical protein